MKVIRMSKYKLDIDFEKYIIFAFPKDDSGLLIWDATSVLMSGFSSIEELATLIDWELNNN